MSQAEDPERSQTRTELARARVERLRTIVAVALGLVVVGAALAGAGLWVARRAAARGAHEGTSTSADRTGGSASAPAGTTVGMTEVPDLLGMSFEEATTVIRSAGFVMQVTEEGTPTTAAKREVASQEPTAGALANSGAVITVAVPPKIAPSARGSVKSGRGTGSGFVVVLDPGHQSRPNTRPEPIGPGSSETRPSMTAGVTGVTTHIPEYETALEIANNVRGRLEAAGVKVVMTRDSNDVNLSNSQRAAIANNAHASLFLRIHADSDPDPSVSGISTLYPAPNTWTSSIASASKLAAAAVQRSVITATGAVDRGAAERSDIVGFNWSKVPSVLVDVGYPSNDLEDRLLSSPGYQDKLAAGITSGILAYASQRD